MGVPHRGSLMASIARNLTLLAMGRADRGIIDALDVNSVLLEQCATDFSLLLRADSFKIHTFVESQDTIGVPGLRGKVSLHY